METKDSLSGSRVLTGPQLEVAPDVAASSNGFLVVWADTRNQGTNGNVDIYGARLARNGDVLNPDGVPLAVSTLYEHFPGVASRGQGFLVVWLAEDLSASTGAILFQAVISEGGSFPPVSTPITTTTARE